MVESGEPLNEEFPVKHPGIKASWLRSQVVKLGDGLAITFSDISESKATQERYAHLAEFTDSVFQNAPFSIVATDTRRTDYCDECGGREADGLQPRGAGGEGSADDTARRAGAAGQRRSASILRRRWSSLDFEVLTAGVAAGEMEEQEWTLIRRDGARTPINLAMRAVTTDAGEVSGYRQHRVRHHRAQTDAGLCDSSGDARSIDGAGGTRAAAGQDGAGGGAGATLRNEGRGLHDRPGPLQTDQRFAGACGGRPASDRGREEAEPVGAQYGYRGAGGRRRVCRGDAGHHERRGRGAVRGEPGDEDWRRRSRSTSIWCNVTASVGVCIYPGLRGGCEASAEAGGFGDVCGEGEWPEPVPDLQRSMLKETAERLTMEHALRHALTNGELSMHYQPQISLTTGAVTGMEALLRWTHPKLGRVSPAQFIPLAEETGLDCADRGVGLYDGVLRGQGAAG